MVVGSKVGEHILMMSSSLEKTESLEEKVLSSANSEVLLAKEITKHEVIEHATAHTIIEKLSSLQLKSIMRKKILATAATLPSSSIKQEGRKSKVNQGKIVSRGLRSFASEREKQLLKHVSTQCFFALANFLQQDSTYKKLKLVEVEMMHVIYGEKHFIFMAANEVTVSRHFKEIIGTSKEDIMKLLTTAYSPKRDYEGKRRSSLYSKKLKTRLFGDHIFIPHSPDSKDRENAEALGRTLIQSPWEVLDINASLHKRIKTLVEDGNGGVFALDNHSLLYKERHSEECLVDIAEIFRQLANENHLELKTCIAGKKRPYISCSGRMKSEIDSFGERPGLLWLHAVGKQPASVAKKTFSVAFFSPSHISLDGRGLKAPDYDSGSDSDAEVKLHN